LCGINIAAVVHAEVQVLRAELKLPLYTYSDHMPLNWMEKTEKGPISSFILEHLSEFETIHQYIQGSVNTLPDACSRYPMLGPKRLATRGLANSVTEMLRRLSPRLKESQLVHYHGDKQNAELRVALQWAGSGRSSRSGS
jgi:hypothetical protein